MHAAKEKMAALFPGVHTDALPAAAGCCRQNGKTFPVRLDEDEAKVEGDFVEEINHRFG